MSRDSEIKAIGQAFKEMEKQSKAQNMAYAEQFWRSEDRIRWARHTPYHWSFYVGGDKIDYWPSTNKFQYKGKVRRGPPEKVRRFIVDKMKSKER